MYLIPLREETIVIRGAAIAKVIPITKEAGVIIIPIIITAGTTTINNSSRP
jgi:hypothetical protein